jgi:hypothetical protein
LADPSHKKTSDGCYQCGANQNFHQTARTLIAVMSLPDLSCHETSEMATNGGALPVSDTEPSK